jgi:hypothetical protein
MGVLSLFLITIFSVYKYDRFLATLYLNNFEVWKNEGSPCGYFWNPPVGYSLNADFAGKSLIAKVSFSTPSWALENKAILSALRAFQYTYYISFCIMTLIVCMM